MRRPDFVRLNAFDNISAGAFSFSIGKQIGRKKSKLLRLLLIGEVIFQLVMPLLTISSEN